MRLSQQETNKCALDTLTPEQATLTLTEADEISAVAKVTVRNMWTCKQSWTIMEQAGFGEREGTKPETSGEGYRN